MDHDAVVRQNMTERYLLNELDPEARDEFEEHYFDCPDCAADEIMLFKFVSCLGLETNLKSIISIVRIVRPTCKRALYSWNRARLCWGPRRAKGFYPKGRQRLRCKCPSPYRRVPDGAPGLGLCLPCLFLPCCWP